jgi:hypothetical protein
MWPVIAAIGGGVGLLVYKLAQTGGLSNLADLLSYEVSSPYSLSVKDSSFVFRIDLKLINPTDESLTIEHPYIKLLYQESQLGYTLPENKSYTLQAKSQLKISGITFKVALNMQFFQIVLTCLKGGQKYWKAQDLFKTSKKDSPENLEAILSEVQKEIFSKMGIVVQIAVAGVPIVFKQSKLSQ